MSSIDYTTKGYIYEGVKGDGSPLNRQITERLVCEFMCDVQRDASGTISSGGVSIFLYNIYLDPIDADIKAGYIFKSDNVYEDPLVELDELEFAYCFPVTIRRERWY